MSDDLIKRSDAIGAITNHCEYECYYRVDHWCPQCQREEFEEAIKAVPSADRPQGEWIYTDNPLRLDDEWECSRCRNISFVKTNFCDRCGAKMKGADDE